MAMSSKLRLTSLGQRLSKELFRSTVTSETRSPIRFASYKAALLKNFEKPLEIKNVSEKKLGKDEIRIDTEACSINMIDVYACKGEFNDLKPKLPFCPGYELSGIIAEVGPNVTDFKKGDKVVCINRDKFGGFAEQCITTAKDVWKLPPNVNFVEAASLVCNYGLGFLSLARRADIKKDDVVVITSTAGGLGLAAIDLAANVYQTKVIGVGPSTTHCDVMREKGAWSTFVWGKKDVVAAVRSVAGQNGAKIIFDAVGGDLFTDISRCVAHEGSVIVAGFASKIIPTIKTSMLLPHSFSLIGVSLVHYRQYAYDIYRDTIEEVIKMAEDKLIEPLTSATYPLEKVNDAFELMTEQKAIGKVIVTMKS